MLGTLGIEGRNGDSRIPDPQTTLNRLDNKEPPASAEMPTLDWRLAGLSVLGKRDHPIQGAHAPLYPPAMARMELIAEQPAEPLKAHLAELVHGATIAPLQAAAEQFLAESPEVAKLDRLHAELLAAIEAERAARKEIGESLKLARQAIGAGDDPTPYESMHVDAINRQRVMENRAAAYRDLVTSARGAIGAGLRRAVETKRQELLSVARADADALIAETVAWVRERLAGLSVAIACVHELDDGLRRQQARVSVTDQVIGKVRSDV